MSDLLKLEGRVALVTGGTRGIGAAIARFFASQGVDLILLGRRESDEAQAFACELAEQHGRNVATQFGDISDPATSAEAVRYAFKTHRRLDILVNNAGVLQDALIGMISESDIRETIDTNLVGVIHATQAAARLMQRGDGGSIINMTSIIGRMGNRGQLAYGASKAGVIGATLSAAKELAEHKIRVNAIAPGFIDTDMTRQIPTGMYQERMTSIAMKRIGTPEDIAKAVLFLASDLSGYVTGQVLGVDGGMLV